ncbi:hypothetical protein [Bacillus sp. OAE603]|uniref:hypothetical protein n=1 Tax=Gottfriedia sp. OAE603 TaxID=2663872 RepID=UPI00178BDB25
MFEVLLRVCGFVIGMIFRFIAEILIEFIFHFLFEKLFGKLFEKLGCPIKNKNEELVLGRIAVLEAEPWFEPYKIYSVEMAQRISIRTYILKCNMNEILSNEEKRIEFLNELDRKLFDLNKNGLRTRKTSQY